MRKLLAMIWKDLYLAYTDRFALAINLAMPLAVSLIVGFAFGGIGGGGDVPISDIGVLVVSQDQGVELPNGDMLNLGDQITDFFLNPPDASLDQLIAAEAADDWKEARARVEDADSGITAAILIPEDFSVKANVRQEGLMMALDQGTLHLYHKSASPISGSVVESVLAGWANRISAGSITTKVGIEQTLQSMGLQSLQVINEFTENIQEAYSAEPITVEAQSATGERQELNVISVIGPSMAIFFLLFNATFSAGQLMVEKQNWTLQRMITTPTPRTMILAGKIVATFISGVIQLAILLTITGLIGASWGSNLIPIVLLVLASVAAAVGLGALIASLVEEPQQLGVYGVGILMVMGVVSGSFTSTSFLGDARFISMLTLNWWSIEGFTALAQGSGLNDILLHLAVLLAMGAVFFVLGVWRFGRRLEF